MRTGAVIFASAIAAVVANQSALSGQQPAQFKTSIQTVAIYATVRDRDGHLVTNLTKDDFEILDNGRPVEIVTFSNAMVPSTIALLLDMNWSTGTATNHVGQEFTLIRDSAAQFVRTLLPEDRVRIVTIGHGVTPSPLLTSDQSVLRRILAEELWPGADLTPLWAAIHLSMDSIAPESGRKVILVLSQSPDGCSSEKYGEQTMDFYRSRWCQVGHGDVTKQARSGDFMVYAIGTQSTGLQSALADVADDTGGGHFHISRNDADLKSTFGEVANELHHQYAIGFEPGVPDRKVHKLTTHLRPNGLTAHARQSYMAGPR
jgi:Ca-activated chloride channel family protein